MYDRMPTLTQEQMTKIHDASMNILCDVGVAFNEEESLDILRKTVAKWMGKLSFFQKTRFAER